MFFRMKNSSNLELKHRVSCTVFYHGQSGYQSTTDTYVIMHQHHPNMKMSRFNCKFSCLL
jgi:hypothetical protein